MSELRPVIVSASIAIDRIMRIAGRYADLLQPDKLDTVALSVFVDEQHEAFGGVAADICYALALLGDRPVLLGSVGANGRGLIDKLSAAGVDVDHVHRSELPTASFTVMSDQAQAQIGGFYPGAMFDSDTLELTPWKNQNPLVVVGPHDPKAMRRQVEQCRQWQLDLCYDVGQQVTNLPADDIRAGVEAAHILICNDYEMSALCAKIGRSEADVKRSTPLVITTLGEHGSRLEGSSLTEPITVGVAQPAQVVDPTGAGDAYRGGFLYGYVRDWPLADCARLGAVTGSYALEQAGPQDYRFELAAIRERYTKNFSEPLPNI